MGQKLALLFILIFLEFGCGVFFRQPTQPTRARLGEETESTIDLKSLPDPKEPIIVAVYKFRDQTGQYKPSENGAGFSTAVTQGATTILIKALENSKWFIPIERENVSNLLNERKIIRSSRQQYGGTDGKQQLLPPLLFAGVILEGGIISYDANVITGGAGLRYFGMGTSGQYRQDRVTVYLRAVSTSNGKILKTVYTSKTILSQALDAGVFQFVRFRRLLEAEVGFTYNEPSELAVTEAIEKAVLSMIVEGIFDGLWELENPRDKNAQIIKDYKEEKKQIPQTDIFGKNINNRRKQFGLGISSSSLLYAGDYPDAKLRTGTEVNFAYSRTPYLSGSVHLGLSRLATQNFFNADVTYLEANGLYRLRPYNVFTPYAFGGLGLISANNSSRFDFSNGVFAKTQVGVGFEYVLNNTVGIKASADYNYIFSDQLDQIIQGKYNDFYWRANIGLNIYFGELLEGKRKFK